jgi:hypothetical protein
MICSSRDLVTVLGIRSHRSAEAVRAVEAVAGVRQLTDVPIWPSGLGFPAVDEPLAELSAYFRKKSTVPGPELVRLTAAARAGGSRWAAIAAACGVQTYQDLAGVLYRISGETGAELLFSATQYAVEQLAGGQRRCHPLTWVCPLCRQLATDQAPDGTCSLTGHLARSRAAGGPGPECLNPPSPGLDVPDLRDVPRPVGGLERARLGRGAIPNLRADQAGCTMCAAT